MNDEKNNQASFVAHLTELRSRLVKSVIYLFIFFVICYFFAENIYSFLVAPYAEAVKDDEVNRRLIFTALQETFITYLKVAFFAAMFISSPIILTQIWKFIAPGLYKNEKRKEQITALNFPRQQRFQGKGNPNLSLSDFIAPEGIDTKDYIGAFAVTSGIGVEEACAEYENNNDDYSSIMLKAIADRLAESLAEYVHEKVRKDYWGYSKDEELTQEALIKEKYIGIRPAPGYPACPDHSEKVKLFSLLKAKEKANIYLTENFAMLPAASVSGWYFSNSESKYFGLGKITEGQIKNISSNREEDIKLTKKYYSTNLE